MAEFVKAAELKDLPPGAALAVQAAGKTLALFNVGGEIRATDNACLHRGGPLGEGALEGGVVTCPWHGWRFDTATGACLMNPKLSLKTYPVKLDGGAILVAV